MNLKLKRIYKGSNYTIGNLLLEDKKLMDTLEPPYFNTKQTDDIDFIRSTKKGNTAIPTGEYSINMNVVSPKFKDRSWAKPFNGKLPTVENVPAFERVLIHVGNYASQYGKSDTQACILVGENREVGKVVNSTANFNKLMSLLNDANNKGETIKLIIE